MTAAARARNLALLLLAGASLAACTTPMQPRLSNRLPAGPQASHTPPAQPSGRGGVYKVGNPYQVGGIWYVPREDPGYDATGVASWYGDDFHMKPTANGETFDMNAISAAHPTLPMPSLVEVTNLDNGKKLVVRLNDRGPFVGGRLIDLSHAAARELGYERQGTAKVRVRYLGPAPLNGVGEGTRYAANTTSVPGPTTLPASGSDSMSFRPLPAAAPVAAAALPPVTGAALGPAPRPYAAAPAYSAPRNETWAPTAMPSYTPPASNTYAPAYASAAPLQPAYVRPTAAPAGGLYRIQAGAFSDPGAARRVADQLATTGPCSVEPVQRETGTVYRVMVQASADEGEAWALRDRVAAIGFADARVIRPF